MKFPRLLASTALAATAIGLGAPVHAADVKEVQMLHWWTSGGEAAALDVIKQASQRKDLLGKTCRSPAAAAARR